jgi:hypothetical protein
MTATFSRDKRPRMAAEAKALSLRLSRTVMDYDARGSLVRVSDPRAQALLRRAFELLLRAGGKPQVLQMAEAEAAAFPRGRAAPAPGATPWLAVGVDAAGMATYCLRWAYVQHLEPEARRACVEVAMLEVLAQAWSDPGFPVAGRA